MGSNGNYKGVIDVLNERPILFRTTDLKKKAPSLRVPGCGTRSSSEADRSAAEGDDTLMEHYINKGSLEAEEMHTGLIEALAEHKYIPVFCGVPIKNSGLIPFLDFISDIGPDPRTASDTAVLPMEQKKP
jgi:elongation factor G